MSKRMMYATMGVGIIITMMGCLSAEIANQAPRVDDMLAQIHTGMAIDDVRNLLGKPERVNEWDEYIDDSRMETRFCQDWYYTILGIDRWQLSFYAHDGIVWGWTATDSGENHVQISVDPYLPGFDGDRPETVYPLQQLYIGMTMDEVQEAFGPPNKVEHMSTIVGKLDENWDYHFQPPEWGIYLQFKDGNLWHWIANGYDYSI